MCNRNSPQKSKSNMGCVRETPQIKKKIQHGMCKGNSKYKNEASTGCVRETPPIKMNPARCGRQTPQKKKKKTKRARDV